MANESIIEAKDPLIYFVHINSDSFQVGINTLCTQALSVNKDHFENLQLHKSQSVKRIAGGLEIANEGTFIFQIQSDDGQVDTICIP